MMVLSAMSLASSVILLVDEVIVSALGLRWVDQTRREKWRFVGGQVDSDDVQR